MEDVLSNVSIVFFADNDVHAALDIETPEGKAQVLAEALFLALETLCQESGAQVLQDVKATVV